MARESRSKSSAVDPLSLLDWPLHAGQQQAWDSDSEVILLLCGTGGGKTTFSPAWLYREIQRRGRMDYLAVSSTFPVFNHSFLPSMLEYFCRRLKWGTYKAGTRTIQGHDGSRILCRAGTDSDALESGQFGAAVLDEWGQDKIPVESWEAVNRRLAYHRGRILIPTTPYNLGWLKQQVWDRAVGGDQRYSVVNFRSIDNPAYPIEAYERAKRELPDWKFQMFYNGIFTKPAGLIYSDYEDSYAEQGGHLVKPFPIPPTWLRDIGVDFGASVHNAQVWAAEEPGTGRIYLYRECTGIDATGPEQARSMLEYREPIRRALGGAKSEDERRREWGIAGLPVAEPFISDVEAGIDRVIGLFKSRRLFVFDTLTGLRSELGTYSRELDDAGEPLQKIADKEKFHRLDALRYLCSFYPLDGPESHKGETQESLRTVRGQRQRQKRFWERETGEYR